MEIKFNNILVYNQIKKNPGMSLHPSLNEP